MKRTSRAGQVAHNLGISTWFGGLMFGQVSLNPTVSSFFDKNERGRVLNEAWSRSNIVNPPAMLTTLLGWRLSCVRSD
jgi:hypothetical protein